MNAELLNPPSPAIEQSVRRPCPRKTVAPIPVPPPAVPESGTPGVSSTVSDQTRTIVARVNVGWGNSVYLRGKGGALNWDVGIPMYCAGDDRWVWCCHADQAPTQFKFLRNDQDWSLGENEIMSGADIVVCSPKFSG